MGKPLVLLAMRNGAEQEHRVREELWRSTQVAEEVPLLRVEGGLTGARVQMPHAPRYLKIGVVKEC